MKRDPCVCVCVFEYNVFVVDFVVFWARYFFVTPETCKSEEKKENETKYINYNVYNLQQQQQKTACQTKKNISFNQVSLDKSSQTLLTHPTI